MLYVISGMLFWYMLFVLPVVCRLLRRCWLPSHKNFAALKKFGVCDNKHFDFDYHPLCDCERGTTLIAENWRELSLSFLSLSITRVSTTVEKRGGRI